MDYMATSFRVSVEDVHHIASMLQEGLVLQWHCFVSNVFSKGSTNPQDLHTRTDDD